MKNTIFWDVNRRLEGTYRLHLQGQKKAEHETSVKAGAYLFDPEDGGDMFLRNVG
jgi:hypothetical protein